MLFLARETGAGETSEHPDRPAHWDPDAAVVQSSASNIPVDM
jgi:hypothetical protein